MRVHPKGIWWHTFNVDLCLFLLMFGENLDWRTTRGKIKLFENKRTLFFLCLLTGLTPVINTSRWLFVHYIARDFFFYFIIFLFHFGNPSLVSPGYNGKTLLLFQNKTTSVLLRFAWSEYTSFHFFLFIYLFHLSTLLFIIRRLQTWNDLTVSIRSFFVWKERATV